MPYMTNGKRDYKKELAWEKRNKPERSKERSNRNKARVMMNLKKGDPRVVDHIDGNPNNNAKSNLRVVSAKANANKEAKSKKRKKA